MSISVRGSKTLRLSTVVLLLASLLIILPSQAVQADAVDDLLLTEIVVTPTAGEFVEIHNPTGSAVDLTNVYLTDATFSAGGTFYYNVVVGNGGGGGFADFNARFPAGASIGAGEYQTVALNGSTNFEATYGATPTYELYEDDVAPDAVPDMLEATPGSISGQGGLSNGGEVVVLYRWDGASDLVEDIDYVVWGDKAEGVDKTGVSIDGPDADVDLSSYLADTPVFAQEGLGDPHSDTTSWQRADLDEGTESQTGGNGSFGADETSENVTTTWGETDPTPNAATTLAPPGELVPADHLLLSEIAVTPTEGEFVEIFNPTASAIDLTDVYLTDATFAGGGTFYYNTVVGNGGGGGFADFNARFPAGASIGAGEYQTVALNGSANFEATYGTPPTYELYEDAAAPDAIPDMLEATPGAVAGQGGLSNGGEVVVLYQWDGASDLVTDLDYVVWGDKAEGVDKTGVSVDGPDADTDTSMYLADTSVFAQDLLDANPHTDGSPWQRIDPSEGAEAKDGGNGSTGNDETSENTSVTWKEGPPTPNAKTTLPPPGGDGGPGGEPDPLPELGVCGDPFTPIYDIQGDGSSSPLADETPVITEGVVTAIFTGLSGYFIQDAAGDGNAATSDGIFVFDSGATDVGHTVRVVGRVMEFFGLTEINAVGGVLDCTLPTNGDEDIAPVTVDLPLPEGGDFEQYEGMLVHFEKLTVTGTDGLLQFGEVTLSAPDRIFIPTDTALPGAEAAAALDLINRSTVIIDDGSTAQTPVPIPFVGPDGSMRLGEMAEDIVGVMTCNFGCHKLEPVGDVAFAGNPRPDDPDDVGGNVKVASYNVLNYWTSLDDGTNPGARGADSAEELARQTEKLVAAIGALGADVIGLQELENNGPTAINALVDALNAAEGGTSWAAVPDPAYPGGIEATNAIKVGIIYRQDAVTAVGDSMVSLSPDFALDRPPVAQTFEKGDDVFTVISNHFKSKSCTDTGPGEPFPGEADIGDGQACFAPRRTRQAAALLEFVADIQAATGDDDVVAVGDFNSYGMEDSMRALQDGGLIDLTDALDQTDRYSFVFQSQSGQLDFAFATAELAAKVTGIDLWHINIDESRYLDYNNEVNPADAFEPDQYRSSDHDPVLLGIQTVPDEEPPTEDITARGVREEARDHLALELPTGSFFTDLLVAFGVIRIDVTLRDFLWIDDNTLSDFGFFVFALDRGTIELLGQLHKMGGDLGFTAETVAIDLLATDAALASAMVDEAAAHDVNERLLMKAQEALMVGDEALFRGRWRVAIDQYGRAWQWAFLALVGGPNEPI